MAAREEAVNFDDDDEEEEEEEEGEEDERSLLVALLWIKCLYRDNWSGVSRQQITYMWLEGGMEGKRGRRRMGEKKESAGESNK